MQVATPAATMPAPGTVVLRAVNLTKRFGTITAVDALNLEVRAGEVLGFLGPNGSGKSTTAGMILGLIEPTAGHVELFGQKLSDHPGQALRRLGVVIESPAFYPYLSGRNNLRALALAQGGIPEARVEALLQQVGLAERAGSKYKTYSLGMKQRLGIASTLLSDPALVILDEPTNGLDPAGQQEVRRLIPRLAAEGRAVLLASHLLYDVEQVCDRVVIIRGGRKIEEALVRDLRRTGTSLRIEIAEVERAVPVLQALPFVQSVTPAEDGLLVNAPAAEGARINRALAEAGLYAAAIIPQGVSLEDVFLRATGDAPADAREVG